jgi:hypothetical protein
VIVSQDRIDFPFWEVAQQAQDMMRQGHTIHQKFTCSGCGTRQTMGEPNKFFTKGQCEECRKETNIVASGCNFVMIANAHQ